MAYDIGNRNDLTSLAGQLALLYDQDALIGPKPDPRTLFTGDGGQYGQYTTNSIPAFAWYQAGEQLVILITGATIPAQGLGLVAGALQPIGRLGAINANSYAIQHVRAIEATLGQKQISLPTSVVIVGHSYGGAIAELLAVDLGAVVRPDLFQVFTMGAPRISDTSLSVALAPVKMVRLMNLQDPVPFFPPHFDEAPLLTIALGLVAAVRVSQYVQPGGGYLMDSAGNIQSGVLPPLITPIADANLLAWAQNQQSFLGQQHFYRTYFNRLSLQTLVPGPPVPESGASLKGEFEPVLTPAEFAAGPVLGPALLNGALAMAVISVYIPVTYRAKVVKVGTVYTVQWCGFKIGTGNTKSNAKTLAKYWNKLLRVMQTVASMEKTGTVNAWTFYFNVASSAISGFMPVLTVNP